MGGSDNGKAFVTHWLTTHKSNAVRPKTITITAPRTDREPIIEATRSKTTPVTTAIPKVVIKPYRPSPAKKLKPGTCRITGNKLPVASSTPNRLKPIHSHHSRRPEVACSGRAATPANSTSQGIRPKYRCASTLFVGESI